MSTTPGINFSPVSRAPVISRTEILCLVDDTGEKSITGLVDTGGHYFAGVTDTGGKFIASVIDTGVEIRVPNLEQKTYSSKDGTRRNGPPFRRNSACFAKQKTFGTPFHTEFGTKKILEFR